MTRPDSQRVVVTGLGLVTPVGNDVASSWAALLAGRSGIGPITAFDASDLRTRIAAEVKDFDPTLYIDRKEARRMDRFLHFAVAAAHQALADADLNLAQYDLRRVGVVIGSGIGGIHTLMEQNQVLAERGPRRVSPFTVPSLMLNSAAAQVSIIFGVRGPNLALATACATGSHAIGEAGWIIRRGSADVMIAGSSEAAIIRLAMAGLDNMGAMSARNAEPPRASRPFDAGRDGFVMGEGAGILILERLDLARARGARIYAELVGHGITADAFHITAPAEDGAGAAECMQMALDDAGLPPSAVDYINAHGTSTPLNDATETRAIKQVFGEHAYRVAISSSKSMTGHLMGAAGGIEAVFSVLAIRDQIAPPTINYETPDAACDLDYVPNTARPARVDVAMSNSFGFGGHNGTVLFVRVPPAPLEGAA
ncbi:MAG: beta-ketoacyl-ACP synthase II [Chloroflexi bacterium]|nr:beta-ketoacyl-ACP synthase II [Chloroflexota bacterium]